MSHLKKLHKPLIQFIIIAQKLIKLLQYDFSNEALALQESYMQYMQRIVGRLGEITTGRSYFYFFNWQNPQVRIFTPMVV